MAKSRPERFLMGLRMHEAARRRGQASFPPQISAPERRRLLRERLYGDMAASLEARYGSS